jgi:hypothetical protein
MMIRRCSAKILNRLTPNNKRVAQSIALSPDNLGEEICNVHGRYMYVEVEGLHGDQYETRENHPGFGQFSGNQNGDGFRWEDVLLKYQPKYGMYAFETWRGKDNLENHDEQIVLGDIPDVWPVMPRKSINMLIRTDKERAWSICESVRKGSITDVSMGCIVTHSFCTVCANRAETEEEFCNCLKYHKGQFLHPDSLETPKLRDKYKKGVWVTEDNRGVFGIECSWITVGEGADPEAKVVNLLAGSDAPVGRQFNNKKANYSSIADRFHDRMKEKEIRYACCK